MAMEILVLLLHFTKESCSCYSVIEAISIVLQAVSVRMAACSENVDCTRAEDFDMKIYNNIKVFK